MIRNVFMMPVVEEMLQRVQTRVVDGLPHFTVHFVVWSEYSGYASTQLGQGCAPSTVGGILEAAVRSDKIAARMDTAGSRRVDESALAA